MVSLPQGKVGVIACSGEEIAEGTVTRLAALKVLHELRPGRTVTLCLPLLLAGGEGDRNFARFHPTITVDGCERRCAARGTAMYSAQPTAGLVVNDLLAAAGMPAPGGRRSLDEAGRRATDLVASRLVSLVDEILAERAGLPATEPGPAGTPVTIRPAGACSCGSGIPVMRVAIEGKETDLVALPLIFRQMRDAGARPDDWASLQKLMDTVKIYNEVPAEQELAYQEAIAHEYRDFCRREDRR